MKRLLPLLFFTLIPYWQSIKPRLIEILRWGGPVVASELYSYDPNLWEIMGQSNAEGHESISNLPDDLAGIIPGCHIFNTNVSAWQSLKSGVNNDGSPPAYWATAHFGAELRLMKLLQAHYISDQYLTKYNLGGTALSQNAGSTGGFDWNVSSTGKLFDDSNTNDTVARSLLANSKPPRAIVWIQGEQDAYFSSISANSYQTNLENFIAAKRSLYGYSVPFIIVRLGSLQLGYTYQATVRAAQQAVAAETNNYLVSADGLATVDGSHYNAAGYDSIANRVYRVLISLP